MKIQYASDLHLEFAANRDYIKQDGILPSGDILVLAGDISYLGDKKMMKRDFFDWCSEHYTQTLIVPGNHEFYHGYDIAKTMEDFEYPYRQNVSYLNNKSIVIGNTELFFTTLWTRIDPIHLYAIERGMTDFRYGVLDNRRFCANDVDSLHKKCLQWLKQALLASTAAHKVIVTHHCPTFRPQFNAYPDGTLNSAFQVDLDSFIETSGADYWIYGHTHFHGGSGETIGKTRLLCNQLGYVFCHEHRHFHKDDVIITPTDTSESSHE